MRSYIVIVVMGIVHVVCQVDAMDNHRSLLDDGRELKGRRRRHRRRSLPSWIDDLDDYRQEQTDKHSFGLASVPDEDTESMSTDPVRPGTDELLAPFIDFTGKGNSDKWGKGGWSGKSGKGKSTKDGGKGKSGKRSDKGKGGGGSGKKSSKSKKSAKGKGKGKGYYYDYVEKPIQLPKRPVRPVLRPPQRPPPLRSPIRPPVRPVLPPPTRAPTRAPIQIPVVPDPLPVVTKSPTLAPVPRPSLAPVPRPSLVPIAAPTRVPTTVAPTLSPIAIQTLPPTAAIVTAAPAVAVEVVPIVPYYIAFVAPLADREPTDDEYLLISQLTTLYFEEIFATIYADDPVVTFERVDTMIATVLFEAGIPEPEYNLYMAFNTSIVFSAISRELPTPADLLAIMAASIGTSYIVDYVWQAPETPFISAQEAVLNTVNASATLPDTRIRSGDFEELQQFMNQYVLPGSRISDRLFRKDDNVV